MAGKKFEKKKLDRKESNKIETAAKVLKGVGSTFLVVGGVVLTLLTRGKIGGSHKD